MKSNNVCIGTMNKDGDYTNYGVVNMGKDGIGVHQDSVTGQLPEFKESNCSGCPIYYVSKRHNNSEFDYWFVINLIDWYDYEQMYDIEKSKENFTASLHVVSPEYVGIEKVKQAIWEEEKQYDTIKKYNNPRIAVQLVDYGYSAYIGSYDRKTSQEAIDAARKECVAAKMLLGFYLDRPQNMIGDTGWDFMKGDIGAGYKRQLEEMGIEE